MINRLLCQLFVLLSLLSISLVSSSAAHDALHEAADFVSHGGAQRPGNENLPEFLRTPYGEMMVKLQKQAIERGKTCFDDYTKNVGPLCLASSGEPVTALLKGIRPAFNGENPYDHCVEQIKDQGIRPCQELEKQEL